MASPTPAQIPHATHIDPDVWTNRLINHLLMAAIVGMSYLLCMEIIAFSATLDALTARSPSESFITVSRIGASLIILLLAKEVLVALKAGKVLSHPLEPPARIDPATAPLVSIIVPAYNEGSAIEATLRSLLELDYPRLEIVLVDDGSTDDTLQKAQQVAASARGVAMQIVSQANSGKWKALNEGIARSTGELILCVDADSSVNRDALRTMVPHFSDPSVAAVSGQVQVRNQSGLLTRLQALEYLVANGSARTAQSENGCVLIVPGPLGLFRRSTLDEVSRTYFKAAPGEQAISGPFSPHTFAEDFELSVMICALGGRIVYEPRAISLTEVPDTTKALLSQRYRWLRGSMQVASRYNSEGWGRREGQRALRWWMALSTIGELYVVPLIGLLLLATMIWTLFAGEITAVLTLWMLVWVIHACTAVMFIRAQGEKLSLTLLAPLQGPYGALLLTGVSNDIRNCPPVLPHLTMLPS